MEIILLILLGLSLGFIIYLILKGKSQLNKDEFSKQSLIPLELYQTLEKNKNEISQKLTEAQIELASLREKNLHLKQQQELNSSEIQKIQEQFKLEFKNLANDLLEQKSSKMLELSKDQISNILNPLREKISSFEQKVERVYSDENKDRSALQEQLRILVEQTKQVSQDANNLASALKGSNKKQGDWGELQLEGILERAGLLKNVHYQKQFSSNNEDQKQLRPDFLIKLPEEKHIIIDSKVSLVAYEKYFHAKDEEQAKQALSEHLTSLMQHVNSLSQKKYQHLNNTNQPDYVLMFVPIEGALSILMKEEPGLFEKAMEKNVVLVSGSFLLAILRTVAFMWRQENQKKNVFEIARESGLLYDKFVGFAEDLENIGKHIDNSRKSYDLALNKLYLSQKRGDTIVGRIERIKELGAKATKKMPEYLASKEEERDDLIEG